MCGTSLYRPKERPELSVAFEFDPLNILLQCFLHLYMTGSEAGSGLGGGVGEGGSKKGKEKIEEK